MYSNFLRKQHNASVFALLIENRVLVSILARAFTGRIVTSFARRILQKSLHDFVAAFVTDPAMEIVAPGSVCSSQQSHSVRYRP